MFAFWYTKIMDAIYFFEKIILRKELRPSWKWKFKKKCTESFVNLGLIFSLRYIPDFENVRSMG